MGEVEKQAETPVEPVRPGQFSLRAMFLLMAACAFLLGFFLFFYPYSLIALPSLFVYPLLALLRLLPILRHRGGRWSAVWSTLSCYFMATLLAPGCVDFPGPLYRAHCNNGAKATKLADVKDGCSRTIAVVEMANSGIHWMEPRDLDIQTMQMVVNPPAGTGISSEHREVSWRARRLGTNVVLADCRALWLTDDTPSTTLRAMLTIAGGEAVELYDPYCP